MERLADRLERSLEALGVRANTPLVAAVSGGPDSMALLHLLAALPERRKDTVVANVDHGLRVESANETRFVEEQCKALGIRFCATRLSLSTEKPGNLAERLRQARYDFLRQVAGENGVILTAHHADDQAVTLLMRLIEGAALPGLAGIPPRTGNVARPLLHVSHAELLSYLEAERIPYVTDRSNEDEGKFRNRVRRRLLPEFEKERPGAALRLAAAAALLRDDDEALETAAETLLSGVRTGRDWVEAPLDRLPNAPVLRRVVAKVLSARWNLPAPQAAAWSEITRALEGGRKANLPGRVTLAWMEEEGGGLLVWLAEDASPPDFALDISEVGDYVLPVGRLTVYELRGRISVRPWFPGDRETCDNGKRKTGKKVAARLAGWAPAHRRRGWPVIEGEGRLVVPQDGEETVSPIGRFGFKPLLWMGESGLKEAPIEL